MQAAAWASDLFLWFDLDYSLSVGQGEPEKNTALASSLFRVLLLLQLWGHFYQAQQVMLFTGGHLCNVHAQWANCLPSALINVQALRVPLSNIWATSEHQVQISDGAAKNWRNWIFWWILLSRFTIFWLLGENLWFYHNVGISCQNVIIIALFKIKGIVIFIHFGCYLFGRASGSV